MRRFLADTIQSEVNSKKQRTDAADSEAQSCCSPVCSQLSPTLLTPDDIAHASNFKPDTWVTHNGMMYKLRSSANAGSKDMVAFDMDSTLIATKSGKKFADDDEHDWKLWDPSVRTTLQNFTQRELILPSSATKMALKSRKYPKKLYKEKWIE